MHSKNKSSRFESSLHERTNNEMYYYRGFRFAINQVLSVIYSNFRRGQNLDHQSLRR